jgi:hypothetical protein
MEINKKKLKQKAGAFRKRKKFVPELKKGKCAGTKSRSKKRAQKIKK